MPYYRLAETHPVGDHSVVSWEWDEPSAHLSGVCCYRAVDLQEWVDCALPELERMGYSRDMVGTSHRVWLVEGEAFRDESEVDSFIVEATAAEDVTAAVLAILEPCARRSSSLR